MNIVSFSEKNSGILLQIVIVGGVFSSGDSHVLQLTECKHKSKMVILWNGPLLCLFCFVLNVSKAGILEMWSVHHREHTYLSLSHPEVIWSIQLTKTCMFLVGGRKQGNSEKTCVDTGIISQLHTQIYLNSNQWFKLLLLMRIMWWKG